MDHNSLRKIAEGQIARFEGNAFQDFADRLGSVLFPGDYQPVRAGGSHGDTKNDGYCPIARVFFAAHATRNESASKTKAKIKSDLEGCLQNHRDVKVWRFLTNNTLIGEIDQFIDNELRPAHPNVTIEIWGDKTLADVICELSTKQIERIIDITFGSAPDGAPVLDVLDISNNGGNVGHFAKFSIKNIGLQTAMDCRISLVGDNGYEWSSDSSFSRRHIEPGASRNDIEFRKEDEATFENLVPNLRLVIEYEDTSGHSYVTGRDVIQELVPSGLFYNFRLGGNFKPPTIISQPPPPLLKPVRIIPDPDAPKKVTLRRMETGRDLWDVLSPALAFHFEEPENCTEDQEDLLLGIFDTFKDWGEISGDLISLIQVRDAQRSLRALLTQLEEAGFVVVAGTQRKLVTGGVQPPGSWLIAVIKAMKVEDFEAATSSSK